MSAATLSPALPAERARGRLPAWWPLAALVLLAGGLRLGAIGLQSFWYDEAFTPVHVLHPSLSATLRAMTHTENSPPLWYLIAWADARILGTGEVALRLPSALAGIALVPVAWGIAQELTGRRAAIACAALVAVNPLFVWYSQEARVYALFALTGALALLCFVRAERDPTPRRMAAFAASGALALLTHYFAVFLLAGMVLWMLWDRRLRRRALGATAALVVVGLALLPLISAQGGHGTQWIGRWPIAERLEAIPQYYLTGASGAPLGHGIQLLLALPLLGAVALGLWRCSEPGRDGARELRAALMLGVVCACGVLIPLALAILGADYLAPRNLIAAMVPLTALVAVLGASEASGGAGVALIAIAAAGFLAISVDVNLSPRLQRGDWRGVANEVRARQVRSLETSGAGTRALARGVTIPRVITTVELGAAPLEYYTPGLRNLPAHDSVVVSEIDETGYAPLRESAGEPPVPGFAPVGHSDVHGLIVYRFRSPRPRAVGEETLRRHVITLAHPEVLVGPGAHVLPATSAANSG